MNSQDFRALLSSHDFVAAQVAIDEGFSLETRDMRDRTIVHWALAHGDRVVAHWVLDHQPNLDLGEVKPSLLDLANRLSDPALSERLLAASGTALLDTKDTGGLTPLMRALQQRPRIANVCRSLISQGADVNAQSAGHEESVLMIALTEKHFALLPDLAAAGANPNLINKHGEMAAHAAASSDEERVLPAFLKAFPGADINHAANSGTPPIMRCRSAEQMGLMLNAGANANVRSANTFDSRPTLLMNLAQCDAGGQVVALAIDKGADMMIEDDAGCTAVGHAARCGNFKALVKFYEKGFPVAEGLDREGISPFHFLLHRSNEEALAMGLMTLAPLGVPVDSPCREGPPHDGQRHPSPLFLAIQQGLVGHMLIFMEVGAKADHPGPNGVPALHALGDWAQLVEKAKGACDHRLALIGTVKGGDQAQAEATERLNAERESLQEGFDNVLAEMEAQGINWNVVDPTGRTCLDNVAVKDLASLAMQLMQRGASPVLADVDGFTAMDRAVYAGSVTTLHAWRTALADAGTPWSPDLTQFILNSPEDPNARVAFLAGMESLAACPEWGTWVNAADEAGNTPLILAAATGQEDLLRFFLTHEANPVHANAVGETALHHAVGNQLHGASEYLRAAGADPQLPTRGGLSAWDMAGGNAMTTRFRQALGGAQPAHAVWVDQEGMEPSVVEGIRLAVQMRPVASGPLRRVRRQP